MGKHFFENDLDANKSIYIIIEGFFYYTGISEADKSLILALHNEYRASVGAANMQRMVIIFHINIQILPLLAIACQRRFANHYIFVHASGHLIQLNTSSFRQFWSG